MDDLKIFDKNFTRKMKNENTFVKSLDGPLLISWDVTNRCNLNCLHCLNQSGDQDIHSFNDEISEKEALDLVDQIIEIRPYSMCLCGGETLLRKDLTTIIKKISSSGIPVNMVSNGFLLNDKKAKELKESGITLVQISLDGAKAKTHDIFRQVSGSFEKALNALIVLEKAKVSTAASFVPNKLNIDEFEDYVDLVVETGCRSIRMMPLLPMGRGLKNFEELEPNEQEYLDFCMSTQKKQKQYINQKLDIMWGDPLEHIYTAFYFNRTTPLQIEIRANGNLGVSTYFPISVGNIRRHKLKEYWECGYNKIWELPEVMDLASSIKTIYDFKELLNKTWVDKHLELDIIDDHRDEKLEVNRNG
ncbi:MAG: radical SAM protein [Desulfosporosinus sp.]|nr:radical SAM protein [Desulfosporosinus sp.]